MSLESLHDLYIHQLKDIMNAEQLIVRALPKMVERASMNELRQALQNHLTQTEEQIARLNQIFEDLEMPAKTKKCAGMEGILKEGDDLLKEEGEAPVKDAGIIAAVQHVEHYEIAAYGTLCAYAKKLGYVEALDLLKANLKEEREADQLLTTLAEQCVNDMAADARDLDDANDEDELAEDEIDNGEEDFDVEGDFDDDEQSPR